MDEVLRTAEDVREAIGLGVPVHVVPHIDDTYELVLHGSILARLRVCAGLLFRGRKHISLLKVTRTRTK